MIADRFRVDTYTEALHLRAGHVYAIETNPAITVAEAAAKSGFLDRIAVPQRRSTPVELPVQADVLLSDLRGLLPLPTEQIPWDVDAAGGS